MTKEEKRTSEDWAKDCQFEVLDPDGWDRSNFDFSWFQEQITKEEFNKRLMQSTIAGKLSLKPCPLCSEPVRYWHELSPDGTITWIRIAHGPKTPCGFSFIEDEKIVSEKWNNRPDVTRLQTQIKALTEHNTELQEELNKSGSYFTKT